jgi:hypothetical protein
MGLRNAYFFKANRYLRYDIDGDVVDVAATEISNNWPALPAEFQSNLDAIVNWGDGHAYFFKANRYLRYDIDADVVDVAATEISNNWPALPAEFQSGLQSIVHWGDGHVYFFKANRYLRYDIGSDVVDVGPTEISNNWPALPAEFQSGLQASVNWDERSHWENQSLSRRMLYVMERLVSRYGYGVNGAAGLVGNLAAESGVIPTRIEGSAESSPLRSRNFAGQLTDFTASDVMNRNQAAGVGPASPGIGLAQWTTPDRRSGMFLWGPSGSVLGERAVFNMVGQIDYLVNELRTKSPGVNGVISNPSVTVDQASDEVVYNFEVPGAILQGGVQLPRTDVRVQQVFAQRRPLSRAALQAYTAAHP